ncbi:hypothetical protein, partial [Bacillus cereus group sp. BC257]|uniref:hypothetical protein n=1 Tax=Bacillus cereus group sp. BC257 TaxID=3445326 RepID=UPI003F250D6F
EASSVGPEAEDVSCSDGVADVASASVLLGAADALEATSDDGGVVAASLECPHAATGMIDTSAMAPAAIFLHIGGSAKATVEPLGLE